MVIAIIACGDFELEKEIESKLATYKTVTLNKNLDNINTIDIFLIATRDAKISNEKRILLKDAGVDSSKILEFCHLQKKPDISPIECFWKEYSDISFRRFVFGMSHSHVGLLECILKGNTFKFSAPSMDLYYHYLVLKDLCANYDMSTIKQVIFELPYYVFNYDVSKCKRTFEQRINFFAYYGDYHHYGETDAEEQIIYEYEKLKEILVEKGVTSRISPQKYKLRNFYLKYKYFNAQTEKHIWTIEEERRVTEIKPHVWHKVHENTVTENEEIWHKILEILLPYKNIELKVCVFPFCPLFIESHRDAIENMKSIFEMNINIDKEQCIDLFDGCITEKEFFDDECHLNLMGQKKLSQYLRDII